MKLSFFMYAAYIEFLYKFACSIVVIGIFVLGIIIALQKRSDENLMIFFNIIPSLKCKCQSSGFMIVICFNIFSL